ncbi:TonB-dependent receptor [Lysobacter humi (ex Lee et al. 2017)]
MNPKTSALPRRAPLAVLVGALLASPATFAATAADATAVPPPATADAPLAASPADGAAPDPAAAPERLLDRVLVRGVKLTSLPTRIPTTFEGITRQEIADKVNCTDAQDALKYLPSLLVRKRYIGDYDHAVLATRASGTGNSARSLVYADGILLSNLLGNGATFAPRWGLVNPEEIERVDVLYGPFSAAYSGNSVGAVVDYVTRMPDRFEAHAKLGYSVEEFDLHGRSDRFDATHASVSLGQRWGRFAARIALGRLDSESHPITFATLPVASGTAGTGTPVTGAILEANPRGQPWYLVGSGGRVDTQQTQGTLKLAFDVVDDLRLSYVFGGWDNDASRDAESYLRDAAGNAVYSGPVVIDGRRYALPATAISLQEAEFAHRMQGLTLKKHGRGKWTWTLAASRFDYARDRVRSPLVALPAAREGGAGRIADGEGTGWTTATAHVTWKPDAVHVVEFGAQADRFDLETEVSNTSDWRHGAPESRASSFGGTTELRSLYAQDTWTIDPTWTLSLGARLERWEARDGRIGNATGTLAFPTRSQDAVSPKAALKYSSEGDWSIKASVGRAVRFPTVSELYQGSIATNAIVNNDPGLRPERSVTSELSWIQSVPLGRVRATLFHETTRDALYSQTLQGTGGTVSTIQNVDRIETNGLELATELTGVGLDDLDVTASATFTDSEIASNPAFPQSEGRHQPRVPRWRANVVATWHPGERWSVTGAVRYSGEQFNTLDNSDTHADAYTGTSTFLVVDARVRYRHDANWSGAVGVDNLGDRTYWNFHPYNQRTWTAEVRYDY